MSRIRIAYLPLMTYPEVVPNDSVLAAVAFAAALGCELYATTFSVDIPHLTSPLARLLIDVPGLIRTTQENSRAHGNRLQSLVLEAARPHIRAHCSNREVMIGSAAEVAAGEARYFDLALLPWSKGDLVTQALAQAVVFGAGRPSILVPPSASSAPIDHLAIAWDESRVAARALADALSIVEDGDRITVLTVQDEKPLPGHNVAETLASSLERRGFRAEAQSIILGRRPIAEALQDAAMEAGAELLAMGGFGHSRIRDFILGGATKGVLADLRLPVLLSH